MLDSEAREIIRQMMEEDRISEDVTSKSLIPEEARARGEIIAGQPGVLAGVQEALTVFEELGVEAEPVKSDGDRVEAGAVLVEVEGPARGILAAERVALNLLSRMSGVATATRNMQEGAKKANPEVRIAATRKTVPLLRDFDKKAVELVGGEPHRYHLGDFVLIKDNHLKLVDSVPEALKRAREAGLSDQIEIEVSSREEALSAAENGADIVMLDNFGVEEAGETLEALKSAGLRDEVVIEASGGIDPSNVAEYAALGVDVISSSYMTMRAPAFDVKLEISEEL
ncbi:hypothetical protein AKJ57_04425 [candidate division MSBL1 archaeon SCGC-AAA259A05]|uniref:Nicotinate-nucleotide pyrophosphorylase [carboxylating] n=1 Tax=candidate division MSBL1 archaeon SCGC-AAA259A05 TaxID=1698259 RepID=A0A133U7G6_9EURY|nr:hypothetical protein AKJ57_04425 [candidate division MSBL1 archaeon SCGC-AAA259A05]